jgi:hypothetical protein
MNGYAVADGEISPAARTISPTEREKIKAEVARREVLHAKTQLIKSVSLWRRRLAPAPGTPVHTYLRQPRGYGGKIPTTIGYLPASYDFPPAMITAIGMARETEPGELVIDDDAIRGVHITSLKPDGSGKAGTDRDKIMVGKSLGWPIVLAPPNDGLGLAVCEGIEDALSVHEATNLGVWAAGSASRMPALAAAVPDSIDVVTIVSDADEAGITNAEKLEDALAHRHFEVRLIVHSDRRAA